MTIGQCSLSVAIDGHGSVITAAKTLCITASTSTNASISDKSFRVSPSSIESCNGVLSSGSQFLSTSALGLESGSETGTLSIANLTLSGFGGDDVDGGAMSLIYVNSHHFDHVNFVDNSVSKINFYIRYNENKLPLYLFFIVHQLL